MPSGKKSVLYVVILITSIVAMITLAVSIVNGFKSSINARQGQSYYGKDFK